MTPRDRYTCEWVECLHAPGQLPSWIKIVGEPAEPPRAEADEDGYQLDGYDY